MARGVTAVEMATEDATGTGTGTPLPSLAPRKTDGGSIAKLMSGIRSAWCGSSAGQLVVRMKRGVMTPAVSGSIAAAAPILPSVDNPEFRVSLATPAGSV